jgi:YD repeat-containing protein
MAQKSNWSAGEKLTADQLNENFQRIFNDNVTITYNSDDTVATITNSDASVTWTFTYNSQGAVSTITDGTNTWTFTYDSSNRVTAIAKT